MNDLTLDTKKEFVALDIARVVAAVIVISGHFNPFGTTENIGVFAFQSLLNLTVPFFFILSGYFLGEKIRDAAKVKPYLFRIFILYLIATAFYLPLIIRSFMHSGESPLKCLMLFARNFVFGGSYYHLWYFAALLTAVALLWLLLTKLRLSDKCILILTAVLYGIGTLGNAYNNLLYGLPGIGSLMHTYYKLFVSTRNGLFFGLFFLFLGYLIRKNASSIRKKPYYLWFAIFLIAMTAERTLIARFTLTEYAIPNMLFCTAPTAVLLFLMLAFTNVKPIHKEFGIRCRHLSALIYVYHVLLGNLLNALIPGMHITLQYALAAVASILFGMLVLWLSKKEKLKFLQYLY